MFVGTGGTVYSAEDGQRRKDHRETECDAYGESMVKATLPGARWTLHHDAIHLQDHRIARQSVMTSNMEVEDLFSRMLRESAITPNYSVPLLSKHFKGYVPDGRQTGIACGKYPDRSGSIYGGKINPRRDYSIHEAKSQR